MAWDEQLDELARRGEFAERMGGEDKIARQHEFGKLTIRERIDRIADENSFHEIGKLAGSGQYDDEGRLVDVKPSNFVFGLADIDGRPAIVSGDDFTVRGGSAEAHLPAKRSHAEGLALELKLPHIRLVDGMGGGGSVKSIEISGRTHIPELRGWEIVVNHLAAAPSVSLALGSVAGIGAARVATSHYSVIVKHSAQMMIAGPALVDWAGLGKVEKEELGASRIHTGNGAIDDEVDSEDEAFERARRFLSYLPQNVDELPPRISSNDTPTRTSAKLREIVPENPRQVYKIRDIINEVVDTGSFFEIGARWGRSMVGGFARLNGIPIALFAEDPYVFGGAWTAASSRKLIRLIDIAATFHLPILHLEDCPGFLIGKQAEEEATIRFGSQALAALGQAPVPFCGVVIRKAFGVAGAANRKPGSHHFRMAWPSGDWGSLPIEGGIEVAYKAELELSDDYERDLDAIKARLNRYRSPMRGAEHFDIEDIIDPADTRPLLCRWAELAWRALRTGPVSFPFRP